MTAVPLRLIPAPMISRRSGGFFSTSQPHSAIRGIPRRSDPEPEERRFTSFVARKLYA